MNGEEIGTAEKLAEIGAEEAFSRLKTACPQVCLAHLYALEGAARNMAFNSLSQETKADLQAFSDNLK